MTPDMSFWEQPEQVERFARRDPDHRLVKLLPTYPEPESTPVLDLGCAAGRNTVPLAEMGLDFHAVDSSRAMAEHTRRRVEPVVGRKEATRRVFVASMEDLSAFDNASFALIVALGVYHQANSPDQWHTAMAETRRVLARGGLVLVASFAPASQPGGRALEPVSDLDHMYRGFPSGPHYMLDAERFDAAMSALGMEPEVATTTVVAKHKLDRRVTVNGLYRLG